MLLSDVIIDIQQRETGASLDPELIAAIKEIADEFGVDEHPTWLLPIFEAVQAGRTISPPVFFDWAGSNPRSFLYEIVPVLGWKAKMGGEDDSLEFPRLGWWVYISHESYSPVTGRGGSEYRVVPLK